MPTLDWLNREDAFRSAARVPTRVLRPHEACTEGHRFGDGSDNLLVQGDNLEALAALLPFYRGRVKCIFIDPPYNTKSAFEHYDDNLEHSQWLSMMLPRLQLLREFLREDGSIWVTIDDNEGHYLKVLMDEVFGRRAFVGTMVWQKTLTRRNDARNISEAHDYVHVYAPRGRLVEFSKLEASAKQRATYTNRDNDPRGDWLAIPFHAPNIRPNLTYPIITPGGRELWPPKGRHWSTTREQYEQLRADGRVYFGRDGNGMAQRKKFWSESDAVVVPWSWWPYEDAGDNREATREAKELMASVEQTPFSNPKPERLLQRVMTIATNPGDLVLDSFLGSGTTAAVAHKMGRRWIGIEMGEHAVTHCLPRLRKVVDGEAGGISAAVGWQGGGGFRCVQLGAPLFDAHGELHADVRFADLAAYLWLRETGTAWEPTETGTPLLGIARGTAVYLLFNGILGDKRPAAGNVLTGAVLDALRRCCWHDGPKLVYGEACTLGDARLAGAGIAFRQLPHALPR